MTDVAMSVTITRSSLGLLDLDINDHLNYIVAGPEFLGGQMSWERNQVSSPFVDGDFTVNRRRQNVTENVVIEIMAGSGLELQVNTRVLTQAFSQDEFYMKVEINRATSIYLCEAADYRLITSGPRYVAHQIQSVFSVPRRPIPTSEGLRMFLPTANPGVSGVAYPVTIARGKRLLTAPITITASATRRGSRLTTAEIDVETEEVGVSVV